MRECDRGRQIVEVVSVLYHCVYFAVCLDFQGGEMGRDREGVRECDRDRQIVEVVSVLYHCIFYFVVCRDF